jgi:hypothetical protein
VNSSLRRSWTTARVRTAWPRRRCQHPVD